MTKSNKISIKKKAKSDHVTVADITNTHTCEFYFNKKHNYLVGQSDQFFIDLHGILLNLKKISYWSPVLLEVIFQLEEACKTHDISKIPKVMENPSLSISYDDSLEYQSELLYMLCSLLSNFFELKSNLNK